MLTARELVQTRWVFPSLSAPRLSECKNISKGPLSGHSPHPDLYHCRCMQQRSLLVLRRVDQDLLQNFLENDYTASTILSFPELYIILC